MRTSPAIADGVVYMGAADDKVYAFALPDPWAAAPNPPPPALVFPYSI